MFSPTHHARMTQRSRAFDVLRAAVRNKVFTSTRAGLPEDEEVQYDPPLSGGASEPLLHATQPAQNAYNNGQVMPDLLMTRGARSLRRSSGVYTPGASPRSGSGDLGVRTMSWWRQDLLAYKELLLSSWINVLLIFVPLGFVSSALSWGAVPTFSLNFLALVPLALLLGDVTEDLALRFGDTIGGLINASFGNVVEIIISISALQRGLYTVVAMSLLGSVLSNLLLVLGCCMLFGGAFFKTQTFNEVGNRACSALLFLSAIGIILPTAAAQLIDNVPEDSNFVLYTSRATAIVLLFCYGCYLYFQLHTHKGLFTSEEEADQPIMSIFSAFTLLGVITVVVAFASEALTGSIEEVSESTGLGEQFLGIIILPIAGNACEHITAVIVATKNKMDLALGVAVGSSIQISLFAVPLCVLVGWATGHDFTLSFDSFSTLALTLSVIHANFITSDATSHWLMGVQLLAVYVLIAVTFLFR